MVSAPKNGGKVPKSPIFAISPVKIGRGRNPVGRCLRLLKTKINSMPSYGLYLRKMIPIPKNERKTPKKPFL